MYNIITGVPYGSTVVLKTILRRLQPVLRYSYIVRVQVHRFLPGACTSTGTVQRHRGGADANGATHTVLYLYAGMNEPARTQGRMMSRSVIPGSQDGNVLVL